MAKTATAEKEAKKTTKKKATVKKAAKTGKKYLVIVESPAKVKTIKKFLGSSYEVDASGGHVRDFPKSQFGIDVDNDFEPKYITIRGKGEVLARLRKEVKKADKIYLATDPDREGEAISWHLLKALKLDEVKDKKVYRISFNEITKNAVKTSLKEPRAIDMNLVDAQQARRMLDRMVGYSISPILWEKVKRGLSAGRVQSVALRMICDREDEIAAFIPEEYWSLEAGLKAPGARKPMTARFHHDQNGRTEIRSRAEMEEIRSFLEGKKFLVEEIKNGERTKKPPIPFTTSTMQQEASKALNFSTQKTMRVAQQLYEGVDVKGHGTIGLITYLRTDSTRVAEEADKTARAFIEEQYGSQYVSQRESEKKASGKIQDAHEAIRPTNIALTPTQVKESLSRDQFRLYQLIWKRFAASRMAAAVYETTSVKIGAEGVQFTMTASRVKFDGFMSVYMEADDKEEKNQLLAKLEKGDDSTPEVPGNRPYKESENKPWAPVVSEACIKCGRCAAECPVGAIPADAPNTTDANRCIHCMRCTVVCPENARSLAAPMTQMLTGFLGKVAGGRHDNCFFL